MAAGQKASKRGVRLPTERAEDWGCDLQLPGCEACTLAGQPREF